MFMLKLIALILAFISFNLFAQEKGPKLGKPASKNLIKKWNTDIFPNGTGLPKGQGSVSLGEKIYQKYCLSCHGIDGTGNSADELAGATHSLTDNPPDKIIGTYWPYATTLFDFTRRAMPLNAPGSLNNNELYAVTAYLLFLNKIIDKNKILNANSLAKIKMPNRHGFINIYKQEKNMTKILAFAGSSRKDSINKKVVTIAATAAEKQGASVTLIDLADYPMPLFNQDLEAEQGMPEKAHDFKQLLIEHDGFLIASPEYNSAFSPLLKNVIDWASRAETENEPPLLAYKGKFACIMAASPGALGGLRGLVFLRMLLGNLGIIVLPDQQAIPHAFKAFSENGDLNDNNQQLAIEKLGINLVQAIIKIK
jgi:NAD(P)H-dependent FMN reductase